MVKKICRYCTSYRPCERFRGVLGSCKIKGAAKGYDDTCEAFSHGPQTWMCGVPVKEVKVYASDHSAV